MKEVDGDANKMVSGLCCDFEAATGVHRYVYRAVFIVGAHMFFGTYIYMFLAWQKNNNNATGD